MRLLSRNQRRRMSANGALATQCAQEGKPRPDFEPVVMLNDVATNGVWLLTELDPNNSDIAYGLCDEADGHPILDHVQISALQNRRLNWINRRVTCNKSFKADKPLSAYALEAYCYGGVNKICRGIPFDVRKAPKGN